MADLEEENRRLREEIRTLPLQSSLSSPHTTALQTSASAGQCSRAAARVLVPTFPRLTSTDTSQTSFLSSPFRLWDGLAENHTPQSASPDDDVRSSLSDLERLELIDVFFIRRWPQYPVLHRPTFMDRHYTPWSRGEVINSLSMFLVNIVLAIGASEKGRTATGTSQTQLPQIFFQEAIKSLDDVLGAEDRDCIQCLLLLCMYGSHEPQSVNLWYTNGLALRLAIGLNLHRCESVGNGNSNSVMEDEMAKRLFWSVYNMDRSICIAMGRPLGIQDADITMPLPLCLTDEMLALTEEGALPTPTLSPDPRDLSTFLHIIQLRRLKADIYTTLHSAAGNAALTPQSLDTLRAQFYARLNQWLVSSKLKESAQQITSRPLAPGSAIVAISITSRTTP